MNGDAMSFRRTLSWSTSLNELRAADRTAAPVFTIAGRFDRAAIMREAVKLARRFGSSCQLTWQGRMRVALRTVWARAKEAASAALPLARAA
jgi:hypothetical protein